MSLRNIEVSLKIIHSVGVKNIELIILYILSVKVFQVVKVIARSQSALRFDAIRFFYASLMQRIFSTQR